MSQLSSNINARKNRSKQPQNNAKKTLYFLIIFTIVCLGVTAACIINTLSLMRKEDNIASSNVQVVKDRAYASLTDKFLTNGISTKTVKKQEGEVKEVFDIGDPIYEYEISYEQISGLKNTAMQDRINKEIRNEVEKAKEKLKENPKYDRIAIMAYVSGNFSNVLSVSVDYNLIQTYGNYDMETSFVGLNYRLDTGEKIQFNDLFFEDSSIKKILSYSAYKAYAMDHIFDIDDDFCMDLDQTDYGYIENKVFKIVAAYNKNPNIDFYFTPDAIYTTINNFMVTIDMLDCTEDIAIYTKYPSKNLYTGENKQYEFYAFTNAYLTECYQAEGTRGDNFYYEVMAYPDNDNVNTAVVEKAKKTLDEKLERYYNIAKENPDKAYMVSVIYFYDSRGEDPYYQYDGYVAETDIDYYLENKDLIISNARRQPMGELWCYDFSMFDENVEYYEQFTAYVDNYMYDDYQEDIITKEDRKQMQEEYEQW